MTDNKPVEKNIPVFIQRDGRKIQIGFASAEVEGQRTLDIFEEFKNQLATPDEFIYDEGLLEDLSTEKAEKFSVTPLTKEN